MISSVFAEECAYALMAEVGATPKPGLVDHHDSGAHTDMDYDTFAASTTAIVPYLARMFEAGYAWESKDFNALFESIRPIGIEAEKAMFAATDGVNTHGTKSLTRKKSLCWPVISATMPCAGIFRRSTARLHGQTENFSTCVTVPRESVEKPKRVFLPSALYLCLSSALLFPAGRQKMKPT